MKMYDFPIVRILVFFILGIVLSYYLSLKTEWVFGLLLLLLFTFVFVFLKVNNKFDSSKIFGVSLYVIVFGLGFFSNTIHTDTTFKQHYSHYESFYQNQNEVIVIVRDKLKSTKKFNRYFAQVVSIKGKECQGKILLNIKRDSTSSNFVSGTKLKMNTVLIPNFKSNNPNQFDYNKYLETKNVFAQVFVDSQQIQISSQVKKDLFYYTSKFRKTIFENLSKSNFPKEELAVVMALILGQQQDISAEVIRDYQFAGAVHILSVSGLHVGFVLMFVVLMLKPFPKTQRYNTVRLVISLFFLWVFAFLAGLSPSVLRSVTMFSFVAFGMYLNRPTNKYHTIAVSLFIILLFEPLFLFDVGFQLSYLALVFIIWVQPILKSIWQPKSNVVKYFWEILTVSFAAQLGTLPLSLYYFHQFPGLFFVTNLLLIPFISLIMGLGLLLIIFAYFNQVPYFLLKSVEVSISLMNFIVKKIASLENFIFQNIPFTLYLLVTSYLVLFFWILYFQARDFKIMILALCSVILFQVGLIHSVYVGAKSEELIVFSVSKNNVITVKKGNKIVVYSSEAMNKQEYSFKTVQSYIANNFLELKGVKPLLNVLFFKGKKILILDSEKILKEDFYPEILIVTNSPKINLERTLAKLKPKKVIATSTNYKGYVEQLEKTCKNLKIDFHSIYREGYFRLD